MDEDKFNQNILKVIEKGLPYEDFFWTFTKGNEDNPLLLKQNKFITLNKEIRFPMNEDQEIAKIGIRADILEYDSGPNDDFMDDHITLRINEIDPDEHIVLTCREEESVINFNFRIVPLYE